MSLRRPVPGALGLAFVAALLGGCLRAGLTQGPRDAGAGEIGAPDTTAPDISAGDASTDVQSGCALPPCLDETFGAQGLQRLDDPLLSLGWSGQGLALQADGKLLVTGKIRQSAATVETDALVARLLPNGQVDKTFGSAGTASVDIGAGDSGKTIGVLPDGRIVVGGSSGGGAFAARLSAQGALDTSFGVGGLYRSALGASAFNGQARDANGRLVFSGQTRVTGEGWNMLLVRLGPQGAPDASFAGDGIATPDFDKGDEFASTPTLLPDGSMLLVGSSWQGQRSFDCAIVRVDAAGVPVASFGDNGRVTTDFDGKTNRCSALVRLPNGRLVAAGYVDESATKRTIAVSSYTSDGALDPSFGSGGKLSLDLGGQSSARVVVALPDGRLVIGGWREDGGGRDFALVVLTPDGARDSRFGVNGVATFDVGGDDTLHYALLDTSQRLLLFGDSAVDASSTIVVMRLKQL